MFYLSNFFKKNSRITKWFKLCCQIANQSKYSINSSNKISKNIQNLPLFFCFQRLDFYFSFWALRDELSASARSRGYCYKWGASFSFWWPIGRLKIQQKFTIFVYRLVKVAQTRQRECSVLGRKIFSKLSGKEQVRVECCPESVEMVLWIIYNKKIQLQGHGLSTIL